MAVAEFDPDKIKTEAFRENPRLARVQRYCEENPGARISLVDAARVANLEASYFSSFFHEKTGVCFHSWLNYTRVLRAMHSLADTDLSITTVSRKVGFRDLRTFQRAFKRFSSLTPTEYRKQARAAAAERAARQPVNAMLGVSRPLHRAGESPRPLAGHRRPGIPGNGSQQPAAAAHPLNCGCGCHGTGTVRAHRPYAQEAESKRSAGERALSARRRDTPEDVSA